MGGWGSGGEGHRVVHKLSEKPTCTEDGKQEKTLQSSHFTGTELYPGKGKAEGTGVENH